MEKNCWMLFCESSCCNYIAGCNLSLKWLHVFDLLLDLRFIILDYPLDESNIFLQVFFPHVLFLESQPRQIPNFKTTYFIPVCVFVMFVHVLLIYLSADIFICLSTCLVIHLSTFWGLYLCMYAFIYFSIHLDLQSSFE